MFASDSKIIGWNTGFAYLLLAISASVLAGVAGAAPDPEPDYRAIRAAYVERDGARYKAAVGAAINHLRRLAPDLCAQQQRRLLETAVAATFDGLETLWLLLQDCVAQAKDPAVRNQALANAQIFVERARFAGPPAPNVAMYAARHDGLVVRGTRGEAVRAMVEQARRSAPSDLAGQPLDRLLGRADVRRALCGLDIRRDQHNRAALPDLIVRALCEDGGASGGFGAVDAMCRRLSLDMSAAPTPRLVVPPSGSLADRLQQTPGVGAGDIERLRDFCDDRIAGSGFAGGGLDALDGHGASACLGGRAEEVAEVGRIAQLIDDCLSSGKDDNPIADDGGTGGEGEGREFTGGEPRGVDGADARGDGAVEDVEIEILDKDIRIDTYRSSGAGGQHVNKTDSAVRITHLPTGIVATSSEKSQHVNRDKAMKNLRVRLYDMQRQAKDDARSDSRKSQVGSGDRSERIRTYNFPQGRVTDHRIGLTLHSLPQILEGDLDPMLNALIAEDQAARFHAQVAAKDGGDDDIYLD